MQGPQAACPRVGLARCGLELQVRLAFAPLALLWQLPPRSAKTRGRCTKQIISRLVASNLFHFSLNHRSAVLYSCHSSLPYPLCSVSYTRVIKTTHTKPHHPDTQLWVSLTLPSTQTTTLSTCALQPCSPRSSLRLPPSPRPFPRALHPAQMHPRAARPPSRLPSGSAPSRTLR